MQHPNAINLSWCIEDVLEIRPDLSDSQAYEVLLEAEQQHDANIGLNWEVLEIHAGNLFPKPDQPATE